MEAKKGKRTIFSIAIRLICVVVAVLLLDWGISALIDRSSNGACRGQRFSSVAEAVDGLNAEIDPNDTSIDYTNYRLLTSFAYNEFTIAMCSYEEAGENECVMRILRENGDGTLSFVAGFTDFCFSEPYAKHMDYYYYTNVSTSRGTKSVAFLYLPGDSEANIYVDNKMAEKIPVRIDDREFYVCAVMLRQDTLLKALFCRSIGLRHTVEIK